jgi:hypothetical protein
MAFTVSLLVTPLGAQTGPFNIYSDVDNYTNILTILTQAQLSAGFSLTVPNNTLTVKIESAGVCGTLLFVNIIGAPSTTPTNTPTVTPTITPTTSPTPTVTPSKSGFNYTFPSKTPAASVSSAPSTGCLFHDTPIIMADKTIKPVQDIQVGDKVLSISNKNNLFNTNKFRKSTAIITGVYSILVDNIININNGLLKISDSHINVIKRDNIWSLKTSKELLVGDILIDINKNEIEITSIDILNESQQVYNIIVNKEHLYFANNILTHNKPIFPSNPPGQIP